MSGTARPLSPEEFFASELERWRLTFESGDYDGYALALRLCALNGWPLPKWVADVAIQQADEAFERAAQGEGNKVIGARSGMRGE